MPDLPLIFFPEPSLAERFKHPFPKSHPHIPTTLRQFQRVSPKLNALQQAFNERRVEVLQGAAGVDPEQVIVIETIDSIDKFINAVSKIEGFEWMGEIEVDDIKPDNDFYNKEKPNQDLEGRLYLVMTNQTAIQQLLTLWERIGRGDELDFVRGDLRGLAKLRDAFYHLKDIRRWGINDRIDETGIQDSWEFKLQYNQGENIRFEIELWYRKSELKRAQSIQEVAELINELGGNVIDSCSIGDINYCGLLVELPPEQVSIILENPNINLVKCDSIMFFRPSGQMVAGNESELISEQYETPTPFVPDGDPIVGILDGLPIENHSLLTNRILIDDPDEWAQFYQVSERKHGTAIASAIIHGDLNIQNPQSLNAAVYIRPIMKPYSIRNGKQEFIPDDILMVDLIHRAIKRIFEGEGTGQPIAPSIRIINFSIGDPTRLFDQIVSPLGRLLDWLSYKYNVLFIISSGNHPTELTATMREEEFNNLGNDQREQLFFQSFVTDMRKRRLLAPAESINSITVGGTNEDNSNFQPIGNLVRPYSSIMPSITNPIGGGFKRSIKPDIVFKAGDQLLRFHPITNNTIKFNIVDNFRAPGIKVASPAIDNSLNSVNHNRGSSIAAALISRFGVLCFDNLKSILIDHFVDFNSPEYEVSLLKTLIIHGASWGALEDRIGGLLGNIPESEKRKNIIQRLIGYGIPDQNRVTECTQQRATVLGFEKLKDDEAHIYELPLPPSLSANPTKRKLIVTLGYFSPIVPTNMKYRHSQLFFTIENTQLTPKRAESDYYAVRRGTIQHEIFEGQNAIPFQDGDTIKIKVNCRLDAGTDKDTVIPYGIAVTMEVAEGINIPIYEEIRTRIATAVQIQQQA